MAFNELDRKRVEKAAQAFIDQHRPPVHLRAEVDLGFRISGQSLEIYEIRPKWGAAGEMMETPIAKATHVKSQKIWKVYWHRADMKWHAYPSQPEVSSVQEYLELVANDENACFFG